MGKLARLKDSVAIVTGGGSGIGKEICRLFASEGAAVAVVDINEPAGKETVKEIEQEGGKAQFWKLNVSIESEVQSVFKEINHTFGKIEILVNNAGIIGADKPTHEITEAEWDQVFAVDVKGVFFSTKHVIPYMINNKKGSIVNISSIYGLIGSHELTAYHAAKGAVTIMTKQDAVNYAKDHIRVNSVHPGTIMTELVKEVGSRMEGGLEAYTKLMNGKHPIGHPGEPIDVA